MKLFHFSWLAVLLTSIALLGCRRGSDTAKEKTYEIKGTVVALDAKRPSVKLDHQDVPGLMKAMVMEFDAKSPKVLEGVKPGDKVQGTLTDENGKHVITRLEKMP
jgi:Cu/Ag efflux protein CusF